MCQCECVWIHVWVHVPQVSCLYSCVCVCVYACAYVCMCTCVCVRVHVCCSLNAKCLHQLQVLNFWSPTGGWNFRSWGLARKYRFRVKLVTLLRFQLCGTLSLLPVRGEVSSLYRISPFSWRSVFSWAQNNGLKSLKDWTKVSPPFLKLLVSGDY